MKRFAPIAAIAVGSLLLVGCESQLERNKHACGLWAADAISYDQLIAKLGIEDGGRAYCRAVMGIHIR